MSTQSQALTKPGQKDIVREGSFDLTPHSLAEAFQLAEMMSKSSLVPESFRGKTGDILIAVQLGSEIGLKPMQALSGICVINGRPTVWGDAALAVVLNSGLMENYKEMTNEEIEAAGKAVFWAKRVGLPEPIIREFSIEDAKKARLWNNDKKPIWKDYPFRMLQMRARSWALRDGFADALKGMAIREEVEDIPTTEAPPVLAMPRRMSERDKIKPETQAITDGQPEGDLTPQTQTQQANGNGPACPKCKGAMKKIPEGITKTGPNKDKHHDAFWSCETKDCKGFVWDKDYKKPVQAPLGPTYAEGADPDPMLQREPGQDG